jgi:TRAP-type uncharacterized transport system substrate-binding protein
MRRRTISATTAELAVIAPLVGGGPPPPAGDVERRNRDSMDLVSGGGSEADARLARDHWDALDAPGELRVVAMPSQGSVPNGTDLFSVRNVDAAVVQADVLHFLRGDKVLPGHESEIRCVARLDDEEARVSARPEVAGLGDLVGRKADFGPKGSGAATIGRVPGRQRLELVEPWRAGP